MPECYVLYERYLNCASTRGIFHARALHPARNIVHGNIVRKVRQERLGRRAEVATGYL